MYLLYDFCNTLAKESKIANKDMNKDNSNFIVIFRKNIKTDTCMTG